MPTRRAVEAGARGGQGTPSRATMSPGSRTAIRCPGGCLPQAGRADLPHEPGPAGARPRAPAHRPAITRPSSDDDVCGCRDRGGGWLGPLSPSPRSTSMTSKPNDPNVLRGGSEMAVRRWDPFRDLLGIQNEMNRLFRPAPTVPGESAEAETQGKLGCRRWTSTRPRTRYVITAELAGMTTADIEITVEDNVLTLRGERKFLRRTSPDFYPQGDPDLRSVSTASSGASVPSSGGWPSPRDPTPTRSRRRCPKGCSPSRWRRPAQARPVRVEVKAGPGSPGGQREVGGPLRVRRGDRAWTSIEASNRPPRRHHDQRSAQAATAGPHRARRATPT